MSRVISNEVVTVFCTVQHESAKAVLVKLDEEKHPDMEYMTAAEAKNGLWFPFSQVKEIHKGSMLGDGVGNDRLVVTAWIAKQKNLPTA